jgi:DNA-binding CsgD family transcriptional regulator
VHLDQDQNATTFHVHGGGLVISRTAHDRLTAMGMEAFAERARRELLATGETVRKRTVEARYDFTAQEVQIARLAAEGLSNQEIGAQLFLSPHTVQYHLSKVFTKLGVGSRRELLRALRSAGLAAVSSRSAEMRSSAGSRYGGITRFR